MNTRKRCGVHIIKEMMYQFIDDKGTFIFKNPHGHNLYFPLTNKDGSLLSSISPNLAGDIKRDNEHFLTVPASVEDIRNNLLCRRDFFIKTDKEVIRLSYPYRDTVEAGFLYHKIKKETESLSIEVTSFIPYELNVEVMRVKLINKSNQSVEITPTSFIPLFGRAEKNYRDHRHVSSLLNRISLGEYGIYLKPTMIFDEKGHKINEQIYFVLGFENESQPPEGQFPTLDYFCGSADLILPDAIYQEKEPVRQMTDAFNGKEACAAFRFRQKKLKKGQVSHYVLIMGIDEDRQRINDTFKKLNSPRKITESLAVTQGYWLGYLSRLEFDFKDRNFNNWMLWVKLQPTLRKLFGCSFLPHFDYGKGGRGWRDLWQDALALLLVEPEKARDFIFNNFRGTRIDGSNATIITKEGAFISDRNKISRVWMDHGVWPYLTLRLYLHKTGDIDFLLKETAYFKDQQLNRAKEIDADFAQKDYLLRTKNGEIYKGSILEHLLIQNTIPFFNVGKHNVICLENADWNDGLDMAAEYGESVAFSFMYAHNLRDICIFLSALKTKTDTVTILKELSLLLGRSGEPLNYNNYKEKQSRLQRYFKETKKISGRKISVKIDDLINDLKEKSEHLFGWLKEHEWLEEGFFNGYYDNRAKRVEGKQDGRIKLMLQSQVFALMSNGASTQQMRTIWGSIKKYLKDKRLGGFRLNTDFGSLCLDFGRAFGFSYGDKENGAFFNHMVVMLANALYKRGFVEEGFEAIHSIYLMAANQRSGIYPGIPEYFNGQGKGLYLYLTGSASWYVYTLMEEVLGIKFMLGDIILEPKLISGNFFNSSIEATFSVHNKEVNIVFAKRNTASDVYRIREVTVNNTKISAAGYGYKVKKEYLTKKQNTVRVYLT